MLTRWYDIDREIASLGELHRRMDRLFDDTGFGRPLHSAFVRGAAWPRANLYDTGQSLVALIQVPGLSESALSLEVHGEVLSISGERKVEAPEGYRAHRVERGSRKFTRTFGLPCAVDPEKTTATLKDGLLTVTMDKHPESQPRQISVTAG